ncbi:DUF4649 family protein [Streptococcus pneumoniae]|nr:DUF4649 family protein [Streptococcus pneumoniae]
MIEITYIDASKNERTVTFESYEDFERSQQACLIGVADYYPVQKLTYKGEIQWQKQLQMQHSNKKQKTVWS